MSKQKKKVLEVVVDNTASEKNKIQNEASTQVKVVAMQTIYINGKCIDVGVATTVPLDFYHAHASAFQELED